MLVLSSMVVPYITESVVSSSDQWLVAAVVREILAESSSTLSNIDDKDIDLGERNIKYCKRKISDGHYTAAFRVLFSSGVAPYSDATLEDLKTKHLFKPAPFLPHIPFDHHHLIASQTVILIQNVPLTPLVKLGGNRPIVVGTVWRHLVFKVSALMNGHSLDGYLDDLQFGVGCGEEVRQFFMPYYTWWGRSVDIDICSLLGLKRLAKTIVLMDSWLRLQILNIALCKSQREAHTFDWLWTVPISSLFKGFVGDIYKDHDASCAEIIGIKHRHNFVRDTLIDICYRSGILAGKEVDIGSGISGGKEMDIGLGGGQDKHLRPADMLFYSWEINGGIDVWWI
ncbi:hypothetical protein Tco_1370097 [Tanacetum coccineum]